VSRIEKMRLDSVPHLFLVKLGWLWWDKGFMHNHLLVPPLTISMVVDKILGISSMLAMSVTE